MPSPTMGLCMIVKNEEDYIIPTLDKVVDMIDYFSISDTGSTDNTYNVIKEYLDKHNKKYDLTKDEWVGFSHNRNIALSRMKNKVDFIMLLDADDHFFIKLKFKDQLPVGKDVCFSIFTRHAGNSLLKTKRRIIAGHLDWYYMYHVHEQLRCKQTYRTIRMREENFIVHTRATSNETNDYYHTLILKGISEEPRCYNYHYHNASYYGTKRQYKKGIEVLDHMLNEKIYKRDNQYELLRYKRFNYLYRLNTPYAELEGYINEINSKYELYEPTYLGIVTLIREKNYEKAYEIGKNYYKKGLKMKYLWFDYYKDLYTGKFDKYFEDNVLKKHNMKLT